MTTQRHGIPRLGAAPSNPAVASSASSGPAGSAKNGVRAGSSEHCSRATATESGGFGEIELVDVGDGQDNFSQFLTRQAEAARQNDQKCLLVTMLPRCPSCAALGYAIKTGDLARNLGKTRVIRLDIDEFEEDARRMHLPIDRVPGFVLVNGFGAIVDFIDAGEWTSNDPAEFGPILSQFVNGQLVERRYYWSRVPHSRAIDL